MKKKDDTFENLAHAIGALGEEVARAGCSATEFLGSMAEMMTKTMSANIEYGWISRTYMGEYPRRLAIQRFKTDCLSYQTSEGWCTLDEPFVETIEADGECYGYRITQKCWRLIRDDGLFRDSKVYIAEEDTWVKA